MKQHFLMLIAMIISCYGSSDEMQMAASPEAGKAMLQSEWDLVWQKEMSKIVDPYYQEKYPEGTEAVFRYVGSKLYRVSRPNHGTLHAIRTGLLAVDVARMMEIMYPNSKIGTFMRAERIRVGNEIDKKIFFAAMFQRVGRRSELRNTFEWVQISKEKFKSEAQKLKDLYEDPQEIEDYGDAQILTLDGVYRKHPAIVGVMSERARIIGEIIHAGHKFDLRRIMVFDADEVQRGTRQKLRLPEDENVLIQILWNLSGLYLRATHDTDMVPGGYLFLDDGFLELSNDLDRANDLLHNARVNFWISKALRYVPTTKSHQPASSKKMEMARSLSIGATKSGLDVQIVTESGDALIRDLKLVHGTKANVLFPMLKRTNFEMLGAFDLLQRGSCPMIGEFDDNGLREPLFVDATVPSDDEFDFRWYVDANYLEGRSQMNYGNLITTPDLKRALKLTCDDMFGFEKFEPDRQRISFVKLSIAVMRLKLFDPLWRDSDATLRNRIWHSRQRCLDSIKLHDDMHSVLARASDPHNNQHVDPLTESEQRFMSYSDIPIVIGTTSYFDEGARHNLTFGKEINVLIVEQRHLDVVKDYLEREFTGCVGVIQLVAVKNQQ